jgi:hypothetical protein
MKNTNKKTISEAVAQAMGLGAVSDGKPDYDATGRGSMSASPVVTGMPSTTPVGAPVVPMSAQLSMGGGQKMANSSPEEEGEETEETEEGEEEMQEEARAEFRDALVSLLGEENINEDLIVKLEAIFEASIADRVQKVVEVISESADQNVKQYLDNLTEALVVV